MQVYIVMYQDSNGQKYAGDVYENIADAEEEAREECSKPAGSYCSTAGKLSVDLVRGR